ncbi:arsenate reductase (glutaredoxin) [Gilvimarinus algae]|uniref:Arsenate reductase n=1 Tax=Gilvimarinus algae TaxID=3058037 RepID=A0ABT8TF00_9GAMM|nr:arsenate reductase (glutaredoxin) [Gilvimarinus sp. SDUM040014]MDO3382104.1 arsenate reductase (glutaredoxin) [Gilvimarinus sp. SDUM040014]
MQIYHNPRCSKSRQALALLHERGIEPEIIKYLDTPPTTGELKAILQKLNMTARQLLRRGEPLYSELELDRELSEEALIELMCNHPKLIERPIVITSKSARVGRPPENVLELL